MLHQERISKQVLQKEFDELYINYKDEHVFTQCIKNKDKAVCLVVSWMEWISIFMTAAKWMKHLVFEEKKLLGGNKVSME